MMGLLTFLKDNYKIIGVVLIAVTSFFAGYNYSNLQWENKYYKEKVEQMQRDASMTTKLQSIADLVQQDRNKIEKQHDKELNYYRTLIDRSNGVLGDTTSTAHSTATSGSSDAGTSGERLSKESARFLFEQANRSDRVVDQLLQCQKYISDITHQANDHGGP